MTTSGDQMVVDVDHATDHPLEPTFDENLVGDVCEIRIERLLGDGAYGVQIAGDEAVFRVTRSIMARGPHEPPLPRTGARDRDTAGGPESA